MAMVKSFSSLSLFEVELPTTHFVDSCNEVLTKNCGCCAQIISNSLTPIKHLKHQTPVAREIRHTHLLSNILYVGLLFLSFFILQSKSLVLQFSKTSYEHDCLKPCHLE